MTGAVSLTDLKLVQRFQGGDRSAFTEFVRRYQDRVFSLAYRWLGEEQLAREVSQDVFLALFRGLASFRGDSQLSTFVYRVVINHCKNKRLYSKRRHVHAHEPLEGEPRDDEPARELPHGGPGTDAGVHRTEASAILQEGLAQLDDEERQIILLRDVEDLSYEEIAEILGIPPGTVRSRIHRGRLLLQQKLKEFS